MGNQGGQGGQRDNRGDNSQRSRGSDNDLDQSSDLPADELNRNGSKRGGDLGRQNPKV